MPADRPLSSRVGLVRAALREVVKKPAWNAAAQLPLWGFICQWCGAKVASHRDDPRQVPDHWAKGTTWRCEPPPRTYYLGTGCRL